MTAAPCSLITALDDIWTTLELPRAAEARSNNVHFIDYPDPSVNCGYLPGVRFGGPNTLTSDGGFYSSTTIPFHDVTGVRMSLTE